MPFACAEVLLCAQHKGDVRQFHLFPPLVLKWYYALFGGIRGHFRATFWGGDGGLGVLPWEKDTTEISSLPLAGLAMLPYV